MVSKEYLGTLVKRVERETGLNQQQIARNLGYGSNYISEILSPTGKVTKKFLNAFNRHYKSILENPKNPKKNNNKAISDQERLLRLEAHLEVFGNAIVDLLTQGDPLKFSNKQAELRQAIEGVVNRRIDELNKQ